MTTPDPYPSIPEATEEDLAIDLSWYWRALATGTHPGQRKVINKKGSRQGYCFGVVRVAAHHARRAAEAEQLLDSVRRECGNHTPARHAMTPGLRDEIETVLETRKATP